MKKTDILCSFECGKWSSKCSDSGGVSCWPFPYQRSRHPQSFAIHVEKRIFHVVSSVETDHLKVRIREGSIAGLSHIRKACAPRLTHDSFILKVWKKGKIHIIVEIWGHMLFCYGRGQQSTPPESRKIRIFRRKPKKKLMCFSPVVFYIFSLRKH